MSRQPSKPSRTCGPTRSRPARLLFAVAALLLAAPALGATYTLEIDGNEVPVGSRRFGSLDYVSAADLAAGFGGRLREDPGSGNFILEIDEAHFILSAREGLVSIDGSIISLRHPNQRTAEGHLWISPEFIDQVLPLHYPRTIRRLGNRIVVGGAPAAFARLRTNNDAAGTQAVIEFSRPVRVEHQTGPQGVKLRVNDGPLTVEGLPRAVDGDEVTAVWYEPADSGIGGVFSFDLGPAFGGTSISYLEDPYRVMIQFLRKKGMPAPTAGANPPVSSGGPVARGIHRVILDPGHGGGEVGAQGPSGLVEKDVVLDIARRAGAMLRRRLGVDVVMTRDTDLVIPLDERAGIANNAEGDLFISIHANASRGARASGAETYFLSMQATDEDSASLARVENQESKAAPAPQASGDLGMVLWDLAQSEYRIESFELAETIQKEMNELLNTRDRGVRQAPFRVLVGVAMPAVLVEVAFISNPAEETALRTPEFRDRIAQALAAGIESYKRSYEARMEQKDAPRPTDRGAP